MNVARVPLIILGMCVWLGIGLAGCERFSPEAKKAAHRDRGKAYLDQGQYQEALIEYKNISQLDQNDADAHYQMALAYMKLGGLTNLQHAFGELTKTVELDKANVDAQLKLGEFYLMGNKPDKARAQADIVLASAPQSLDGLALKGRSLLSEQRYEDAISQLKKAVLLAPKNMQLYIDLARAYVLNKDHAAAAAVLAEALEVDPKSIPVLLAVGDYRMLRGRSDEAEEFYKRALEIEPSNSALFIKLGGFYQIVGKTDQVERVYQQMSTARPDDEHPHLLLGDLYMWLGQPDKALASFKRATEVKPDSVAARDKLIAHYLDMGNMAEVESRVKVLFEKDKRDLSARFFDARLKLAKREVEEAAAELQGVIKDEPQSAPAHYYYGIALLQKQQVTQARGEISEAVKLAPGMVDGHIALAGIHLAEGVLDLAVEEAETALRLNPRKLQAAVTLGEAYVRKGEKQKGKKIFEEIAKGLPSEAIGPYWLGVIARLEKNDTQAVAYFEEALKRKPSAIEPLDQLAALKVAQGKIADARDRVIKQLAATPANALIYNLLGQLWVGSKDHAQAEAAFKKAIEQDATLLPAYVNLGALYQGSGRLDEAVKEYEAVVAKHPSHVQAMMLLGTIYEGKKEYDKAIARYKEVLNLNPKFAPAANNLAWIMAEQGTDLDVALSHAQTARQAMPNDPGIADTLGWIYYKKNAFLMAVEFLREASDKLQNNPLVQYHYGMALYKKGDVQQAKKVLESSLKLSPKYPGSDEARKTIAEIL